MKLSNTKHILRILCLTMSVVLVLCCFSSCKNSGDEYSVYESIIEITPDSDDKADNKGDTDDKVSSSNTSGTVSFSDKDDNMSAVEINDENDLHSVTEETPFFNHETSKDNHTDGENSLISDSTDNNTETEMEYSDKNIEYIGRFSHKEGYSDFAWSGTKINAGFKGTKIGATLKSSVSEDYLNIYIDGKKTKKLEISSKKQMYILAENLSNGKHTVEIEKCTEGIFTTISFCGFDYFDGEASLAPAKKDKTIMFIGDSVTAGYGVLSTESGFRLRDEDISDTYAGYVVKQLNADGIYIAISGQGMAQDLGGNRYPVMKDYFQSTLPQNFKNNNDSYDIKNEKVDVILINLGTNDFASNMDTEFFKTKYSEFIAFLREKYPKAYIVCMAGPDKVGKKRAESYIKQVVEKVQKNDKNVYFVSVSAVEGKGSDGHPSESEQKVAGAELVTFLRKLLK